MTSRLAALLAAVLASALLAAPAQAGPAPIDDGRLQAADGDAAEWLLPGRDYADRCFSPLDRIDTGNVGRLVPKWIYQTGTAATLQTTPLVTEGVMVVTAPGSHVMAVDARSGREI